MMKTRMLSRATAKRRATAAVLAASVSVSLTWGLATGSFAASPPEQTATRASAPAAIRSQESTQEIVVRANYCEACQAGASCPQHAGHRTSSWGKLFGNRHGLIFGTKDHHKRLPVEPPLCPPSFGYHQTCWRRLEVYPRCYTEMPVGTVPELVPTTDPSMAPPSQDSFTPPPETTPPPQPAPFSFDQGVPPSTVAPAPAQPVAPPQNRLPAELLSVPVPLPAPQPAAAVPPLTTSTATEVKFELPVPGVKEANPDAKKKVIPVGGSLWDDVDWQPIQR